MATAAELIRGALRLIGQIAEGETPSNETYVDALEALNQLIESWTLERINVLQLAEQTLAWPSGQSSRTFGPSGNIAGTRPTEIDHAFVRVGTIDYPLTLFTVEQYNDIADKTLTGSWPCVLVARMDVPDVTLNVWPVPSASVEIHLASIDPLDQPATLGTELVLAPGYLRALRYNLAMELAPEFGVEVKGDVMRNANKSLAAIQRVNAPLDTLRMPSGMPGCGVSTYDINQG